MSNEAMNTELKRIRFLLEAKAEFSLARDTKDNIEAAQDLPPYITNYIGSKQKLVDWIWVHTPDGVASVLDAPRSGRGHAFQAVRWLAIFTKPKVCVFKPTTGCATATISLEPSSRITLLQFPRWNSTPC